MMIISGITLEMITDLKILTEQKYDKDTYVCMRNERIVDLMKILRRWFHRSWRAWPQMRM